MRIWKDLLYKEVRSTLTATNSNIKIVSGQYHVWLRGHVSPRH